MSRIRHRSGGQARRGLIRTPSVESARVRGGPKESGSLGGIVSTRRKKLIGWGGETQATDKVWGAHGLAALVNAGRWLLACLCSIRR
jgi:hypothetical protein